jgi:hypothetical protein
MRGAIRQSSDHGISPLLMPSPENKWLMYVLSRDLWCEIDIAADLAIAEELVGEMAIGQNCSHVPA